MKRKKEDFLQLFSEEPPGEVPADAPAEADAQEAAPQETEDSGAVQQEAPKEAGIPREQWETLIPGLRNYAAQQGLDPEHLDFGEISQRLSRKPDITAHLAALEQQSQRFSQRLPGFDLRQELKNPLFAYLTSPNVGVDVETAFFAAHQKEIQRSIMRASAKKTTQMIANALASGSLRPEENGGRDSGHSPRKTYAQMNRTEREQLKKEVMDSQYSGKKVYI